jgi:hypothetical protein
MCRSASSDAATPAIPGRIAVAQTLTGKVADTLISDSRYGLSALNLATIVSSSLRYSAHACIAFRSTASILKWYAGL